MLYLIFCRRLHSAPLRRFFHSFTLFALLLLSACGGGGSTGGGGSNNAPPGISATVLSFDDQSRALGLSPGPGNSSAQVTIKDDNDVPISNATVTINGTALSYVASLRAYSGSLTVQLGETISLSVTVAGALYTGTGRQFDAYPTIYALPTIHAPTATTVWTTQMANRISWQGAVPGPRSTAAVGVMDRDTGAQLWPAGGVLQSGGSVRSDSVTVPGSTLTPGNRLILVGSVDGATISGAKTGSVLTVSAFSAQPVKVIRFQPDPSPTPASSQAVGIHIDPAHVGRATVESGQPAFPPSSAWVTALNNNVSYPVIADGKVFVLTDGVLATGTGKSLYALDEKTGDVIWGPVTLRFESFTYAAHAYDHGKVFVTDYNGKLSAFDAGTGAEVWSETLLDTASNAAPTAVNGFVYVGSMGALFAVDGQTGAVVWRAAVPDGGTVSTPTLSGDGLFVTSPCHAYKFDALTGNMIWSYVGVVSGGGRGNPGVVANNKFYDPHDGCPDRGRTFDAATGTLLGGLATDRLPAFSGQTGFFLANGVLKGIDQASGNILWNFTGDGQLTTAPIVVNDYVIAASTSGKVYALSTTTGAVAWNATTASPISYGEYDGIPTVLGGNAVGDGYLVVPAGNTVTAWRLEP